MYGLFPSESLPPQLRCVPDHRRRLLIDDQPEFFVPCRGHEVFCFTPARPQESVLLHPFITTTSTTNSFPRASGYLMAMGVIVVILLLNQPVLGDGGRLAGVGTLLALDLDRHALVLLQGGGEVGLLGGQGSLGLLELENVALGVVGLDCWYLVGLELFQVELLDEVGCGVDRMLANAAFVLTKGGEARRWRSCLGCMCRAVEMKLNGKQCCWA